MGRFGKGIFEVEVWVNSEQFGRRGNLIVKSKFYLLDEMETA
jgi:hypothetical protein